jgi:hypothetical protein
MTFALNRLPTEALTKMAQMATKIEKRDSVGIRIEELTSHPPSPRNNIENRSHGKGIKQTPRLPYNSMSI